MCIFAIEINIAKMTVATQSARILRKPNHELMVNKESYISSKDFFSLLRQEVDEYYENL